jgi:MoaA/NifB/PqqE/SkfB family radical SAM enzyme
MKLGSKVIGRSFRNLFLRNTPFFAHLCVTHRCNLRCRYCHIWEEHSPELDFETTCRLIDACDSLGCAILSITGGEPLLRDDIYDIIEHAKSRELYVWITSNGVIPLTKLERLLRTRIDAITISIDGVHGNDLPHSKVGPQIQESFEYLVEHRQEQAVSICTVLHSGNISQVEGIVEYAKRHGSVGVFVQPVVVGSGKLRVATQQKVDSRILAGIATLDPAFFVAACGEYFRSPTFDWRCRAGQLFFDIKPNGDFWICQDFPTTLNVLDRDFLKKWKEYDFAKERSGCAGCGYSCYYITQEAFEIRHWGSLLRAWKGLHAGAPRNGIPAFRAKRRLGSREVTIP